MPRRPTETTTPISGRGTASKRRYRALSAAVDWIEVARQRDDDRASRHEALQKAVECILEAAGR